MLDGRANERDERVTQTDPSSFNIRQTRFVALFGNKLLLVVAGVNVNTGNALGNIHRVIFGIIVEC